MDKHDRFIAINQTLPGLEEFLKVVLGSEPLSESANRQRIEFLKRLESVSRPPSLPPRPANLGELFRARLQGEAQPQAGRSVQDESSIHYRNDRPFDPIEFASQQRQLSRAANIYRSYVPQKNAVGREDGNKSGGALYIPSPTNAAFARDRVRDSIKSTSSGEDDLYERLSLKGISPEPPVSPCDADAEIAADNLFAFPTPPRTPHDHSSGIYGGARGGSFRVSGGKGKMPTGWFKKEVKVYEEVYVSNLREPVIKGYLRDVKTNKRRWCVLQGDRLHIFKNQDDAAIMIIDLPDCNIAIDDKKKISYSFRLNPAGGQGVSLAIEDGCDLSPWMSAIMAAAVRRSNVDRPNSPLDGAFSLEESRLERLHDNKVDGVIQGGEDDTEDIYEKPMDCLAHGSPIDHSTPTQMKSNSQDNIRYDAPLPPLPNEADDSSSESSSDEDESVEKKEDLTNKGKKKIYDKIPSDLLAELLAEQQKGTNETSKSQDSVCDGGSANDQLHDFVDSNSEHSGNVSNRHSYTEALASDDTGSSEPRDEKSEILPRKRTSTVLSNISLESVCSDIECAQSHTTASEQSGFKVKRRRRLIPPDAELQFLQDPGAMHSGILYKKRRLGVWSKRYCKIVANRFKCYRNPGDVKPSLDLPVLGYDISLIDSKESRKSYCIKISHPTKDTYYFATDSRVSVERWIEVLSLVATGRVDIIAPYPPYFCGGHSGDELVSKSQESLLSSEGRLSDDDSADTLDELDPPADKNCSLRPAGLNRTDATLNSNELNATSSADTRIVEISSTSPIKNEVHLNEAQQNTRPQTSEAIVKERVPKKRKEKPSDKEGTKTPSTMSPPHSLFIGESASGEAKPEPANEEDSSLAQATVKENSEEASTKKDRRWTETLKKKQAKTGRGYAFDHRLRGNILPSNLPEPSKNKILSIRRKNSQSFAHLVALFDKEGRFCGYLTEAKYKKYGTTHLRRWCVVKNGVLNLYNNETEEVPHAKLSLVDMWLTDRSDESRNKYAFALEDKEGNETILQTPVKEDYQKWMGVLEVFTELRVERPNEAAVLQKETLKKTDSSASEDGDGSSAERGVYRTKTPGTATKQKEEIHSSAPTTKVRSSLRMKLSQRVNVREIFRKSHSSYDMEAASLEETTASSSEIDTVAVFGGLLTEVVPTATGNDTRVLRWCSVKEKVLLVFSDSKASDPLRKMPLLSSLISNLSDVENNVHRFKVQHGNDIIVLDASDSFDLNRWLRMLASSTERRNSSEEEPPKCVGRLTSPTFAKKKFLVRRTRSEAFPQQPPSDSSSTTQWYTGSKEHSVNTDWLMSGYLQQVRETSGARTLLRRWCVATSETFSVYDNQNSKKASYEWLLSEMALEDHSDLDVGSFNFSVLRQEKQLDFQVIDEDSARHWLSVLSRYCHTVATSETVGKKQVKSNSLRREERGRSASDNDLKTKTNEKEANVLEILSEGRASGRKLARRVSEDGSFFRKFSKPDLFKSPRRGSNEKLDVKFRENPGRGARSSTSSKRFSCGSLFDSEGKYSGHLMELITSDFYSSQVRRWCLQSDDYLYVYEHEAADKPLKLIPLFNAKVVDRSDLEACVYRFGIEYGENNAVFFRALTRTDLEKWTTVISVKSAVLQDRCERQLRRSRTLSSETSATETPGSSESRVPSLELKPSKAVASDCCSPNETFSVCSGDSVFGMEGDNTACIEVGSISTRSNDVKSPAFVEELSPSSATLRKDTVERPSPELLEEGDSSLKPRNDDGDKSAISDSERANDNLKTVTNLSHIDDLSHIYENFLAFASEMVERSPEFQQQLYHIYENVSLAYDTQHSGGAKSCNEVATSLTTNRANLTESKLPSPSADMSSEFEKISLRETDDISYRYSGICGESELENLDDSCSELEQSASDSVAESSIGLRNEGSDEGELSTVKRDIEAVVLCHDEKPLKRSASGEDEEDIGKNTSAEESFPTKEQHAAVIELHRIQDDESKLEADVHAVLRRMLQDVASSEMEPTDLPQHSEGDSPFRKTSNLNSSQVGDMSMAVAVQREENSFRFINETRNEQVWAEIEGEEVVKPIVEARQILHATCISTIHGVVTDSDAGRDHQSFSEWTSKHKDKAMNVVEGPELNNTCQQTPLESEPLYLIEAEEGSRNNSEAPAAELVETFSKSQICEGGLNDTQMKKVEENSVRSDLQNVHQDMMVASDGMLYSQEYIVAEEPQLSSLSVAVNNVDTMEPEGVFCKLAIGDGSSTGDDNVEGSAVLPLQAYLPDHLDEKHASVSLQTNLLDNLQDKTVDGRDLPDDPKVQQNDTIAVSCCADLPDAVEGQQNDVMSVSLPTDTLKVLNDQENDICLPTDIPDDLQDQQMRLREDLRCGLQGERNRGTAASSQNDVQRDLQNEKTTNDSERQSNGFAVSLTTNNIIPENVTCNMKYDMAGALQNYLSDDLRCEQKDGMAGVLQLESSDDLRCEQEDGMAGALQPELSDDLKYEVKDGMAGALQPDLSDDLRCEQKDGVAKALQSESSDDSKCEVKDGMAGALQSDLSDDLRCEQKDGVAKALQPESSDDLRCEQEDGMTGALQPESSDDLKCEVKDGMAGALQPELSDDLKCEVKDGMAGALQPESSDDLTCDQKDGVAGALQPESSDDLRCEEEDVMAGALQAESSDDLKWEMKDGMTGALQPESSDDLRCEQKVGVAGALQPESSDDLKCEVKDAMAGALQLDLSDDLRCEQKDGMAEALQSDLSDDVRCEQKDGMAEALQSDFSGDLNCKKKDGLAEALQLDFSDDVKGQQCDSTVTSLRINLSDDSQVLHDVGGAASRQTDLLIDEPRPGEMQTLLSYTCESECVPKWEKEWICIHGSESAEMKNLDQENGRPLLPSVNVRNEDSTRQEVCSELVSSEEQVAFLDARVMDSGDSFLTGPRDVEHEIIVSDRGVGAEDSRRRGVICTKETFSSRTQNVVGENRQVVVEADVDAGCKNVTAQKTVPELVNVEVKELEGENATGQKSVLELVNMEVEQIEGGASTDAPVDTGRLSLISEVIAEEPKGERCHAVEHCITSHTSFDVFQENIFDTFSGSLCENIGKIEASVDSKSNLKRFEHEQDAKGLNVGVELGIELRKDWFPGNSGLVGEPGADSILQRCRFNENTTWRSQELTVGEEEPQFDGSSNVEMLGDKTSQEIRSETLCEVRSNKHGDTESCSMHLSPDLGFRTSCSHTSSLEEAQDLTRSQIDVIKAVTAAFEEILELHGDGGEPEDTKL